MIKLLIKYILIPTILLGIMLPTQQHASASPTERPIFTFSVLSDIHIRSTDKESKLRFIKAMKDIRNINPNSELMVLNGDLTDGKKADYDSLFALLHSESHAPVHATMGNHEFYNIWRFSNNLPILNPQWSSAMAVRLFEQYFQYDKPYHELWLHGFHFLFLSGEVQRDVYPTIGDAAYLSDKQLQWLSLKLAQKANQPVFIFLHQPLPGTVFGSSRETGVIQHNQLRVLLEKYPGAVLFSGHTHMDMTTTSQFAREDYFTAIGSGSIRQIWTRENQPSLLPTSQSLNVEVYPHKTLIRIREHSKGNYSGKPFVIENRTKEPIK